MNPVQRTSANFEHEIDAALKMLGDVQPPAGLTSSIHRNLETAAASGPKSGRCPLWIPAASAAVAALLLLVFLQAHFAQRRQTPAVQIAELPTMDAAPGAQPPSGVQANTSHQQDVAKAATRRSSAARKRPTYRRAANLMSYPLTRQEKLLLDFAQRAKPEDLQDLNPEYQAQVEAQQKAEFEAYLKPVASSGTAEPTQNSPE